MLLAPRSRAPKPGASALVAALSVTTLVTLGLSAADEKPWLGFGGSADNSRYVDAKQITKANVGGLEVAWSYPYADTGFNPVVARGVIYGRGRSGAIVALDAKTGKEVWIHEGMTGMTTRGMNYWESKDGKDRRLIFSMNDYLQEIDASTGKSIMTFGANGVVDLREGLNREPATVARIQSGTPGEVFENLILLGSATGEGYMSPPGDVRAYDILTGKLVWQFHTVPHPGEFGYETWPKDAWKYIGGTNTWGELTVDQKRGIAFFPTGSPTYDYYGADRPGANLFSDCLLALDARTGKRLWHFQAVHHDIWDFDNNAAPQLTTIRHNGRNVDVVAMAGKTGFLYVFDRVTGAPIWPIEERPVPKSEMPGEQTWPTQPFPTVVPPFAKQTAMTEADINPHNNITPEDRQQFRDRILKARNVGLFTPIDFTDTVHIPGSNGGALFGTTAAEPGTGAVYVITQDNPGLLKLIRPGEGRGAAPVAMPGQPIYVRDCQKCHGADRNGTNDGPTLLGVAARFDTAAIRGFITEGNNRMDPLPHLTATEVDQVIAFVLSPVGAGRAGAGAGRGVVAPPAGTFPPGPVVASGPAQVRAPSGRGRGSTAYPAGGPTTEQFVINEYGTIGIRMKPPYTTIVKYDLNVPAIKWRVGFGDDPALAALGITGTGMTQMRNSMVVTSAGLLFAAGGDNKVRAYDTSDGKVLWTAGFGGTFRGGPAMYELEGRQYLLVPAAGDPPPGPAGRGAVGGPSRAPVTGPVGYVAYALPAKK